MKRAVKSVFFVNCCREWPPTRCVVFVLRSAKYSAINSGTGFMEAAVAACVSRMLAWGIAFEVGVHHSEVPFIILLALKRWPSAPPSPWWGSPSFSSHMTTRCVYCRDGLVYHASALPILPLYPGLSGSRISFIQGLKPAASLGRVL